MEIKKKKIKIRYWHIVNKRTKKDKETVFLYGETLQDLFDLLFKKYGNALKKYFLDREERYLSQSISLFLNNKPVRDLKLKLKNGDEILIMPNLEGG
jgi:molybdopterin converting factor small subunit